MTTNNAESHDKPRCVFNTITDITHDDFSLKLTKSLQGKFFADLLRQESADNYKEKEDKVDTGTVLSQAAKLKIENEKKTASATEKAINSGATTIGTFSGPNVQLVGELWVFKNEGTIAGTIPKDTPKDKLNQLILDHMTGTIGKYTITIPEPE